MAERVTIQWTQTARDGLAKLPQKVRRGLLDKVNELRNAEDPSAVHKPLTGPLQGYHRITYSRYRAVYSVEKETLASGDILHHFKIRFVAVGIRKESDKKDVYRLAKKLLELGLIDGNEATDRNISEDENR